VFLKGHAGDPLRTDRVNRTREAIDHPALSCALAVQPDVIAGLAERASLRGRGFLARWLYALPDSKVGQRKTAPLPVPGAVAQDYRQGRLWLWGLSPSAVQGQEAGRDVPFTAGADEALRELERRLEPQLAEGEPLSYLAGWGGKLAGRVFVPARLEDNPHLDRDEYARALENLDPFTRRQLLAGDWSEFQGNHLHPAEWPRYQFRGDAYLLHPHRIVLARGVWRFAVVDPATDAKKSADYMVIMVVGVTPARDLLVLDVVRRQLDVGDILPALAGVCRAWRPLAFVGMESRSSGCWPWRRAGTGTSRRCAS